MTVQLSLFNQRWRLRRDSYRPAGEPINPRLYEVAELVGDREAKAFIVTQSNSGVTRGLKREGGGGSTCKICAPISMMFAPEKAGRPATHS